MRTNLSRHTCSFTDFPWDTNDDDDDDDSSSSSHYLFPRGQDVHNYLERYADRYVRDHCHLAMNCHVKGVSRDGDDRYRLRWTTTTTEDDDEWQEKSFDGVVISSGFFSQPYLPPFLLKSSSTMRILHSSEYRSPSHHENEIVAVIGGSHSAIDIAADVARRAKQVWSIVPRIPYVLPRFVSAEGESAMTTLDDALYHHGHSPTTTTTTTTSSSNDDKWQRQHDLLEGFTDRHRSYQAFGSHPSREEPPRVAISDDYLGWVSTGRIKVIHGHVVDHPSSSPSSLSIQTTSSNDIVTLPDDIDSVICGTGYKSPPLSPLLSDDILSTLEHDPSSNYAPFVACHDVYHPSLPRFGFVGMYKGPYFGVIDLQARLVARRMIRRKEEDDDEMWLEESRRIRRDAARNNPRPQFPRGDYVKLMDRFAHLSNITPFFRNDDDATKGMILPAYYQPDELLARKARDDYERDVRRCREGEYISSIVMKRLMGRWHYERRIVHRGDDAREETVTGRVLFMPPSSTGDDDETTKEEEEVLRYREDGKWMFNGKEFDVFREYEYVRRISEDDDETEGRTMDIYFVEEGKRAHLFLSLMFHRDDDDDDDRGGGGDRGIVWEATSDHLCIADLYKGRFRVSFDDKGVGIKQLEMEYNVKGPSKDYTAITLLHPV